MSVSKLKIRLLASVFAAAALFGASLSAHAGVMYAISGAGGASSSLYTVDTTTGATSLVGATGFSHVTGLAINPLTGNMYGHVSDLFGTGTTQLISIDKTTGAGSVIGTTGEQTPDMTFNSSGTLFAWSESGSGGSDYLNTIDLGTGAATQVGPSPTGTLRTGLAFDSGGTLYLLSGDDIATLDPATGALTSAQTSITGAGSLDNVLEFDENDTLFGIDRSGTQSLLYTIDLGTNSASLIGDMGVRDISALAYEATATVSEPAVGAVLGLGLLGLACTRRRKSA